MKRSIILLIAISFFLGFVGIRIWDYVGLTLKNYEALNKKQEDTLKIYASMTVNYLEHGLIEDLEQRLAEARYRKKLHFYIVKKRDKVMFFGNANNDLESINKRYMRFNKILHYPNEVYTTLKVGEFTVTLGFNKIKNKMIMEQIYKDMFYIARDMVLVFILLIILLLYYFKDFLKIVYSIRGRKIRDFSKLKGSSYEVDLFLKGLKGYEKNIENLEAKNELLGNQVLPALQSEILSGEKPPYDFSCAMVMTDINNYSHIYDNFPKEQFIAIIKEFFFEAAHVVSKHGGLIYKFVGDEAIFYFKDKDHENSSAATLSCVIEMNELAQKITEKYQREISYALNIKSSIAHGMVRIDSMIDTYEIFGTNIIECARILSTISIKDKNTIYFGDIVGEKIEKFCKIKKENLAILKGISGERQLYSYSSRKSVLGKLSALTTESLNELKYYRGDKEICEILDFLRNSVSILDEKLFLELTNVFKVYFVTKSSTEVVDSFYMLLEVLNKNYEKSKSENILYYISSIIKTSIHLIDKNSFNTKLASLMQRYLEFSNKRIVANALDVFVHFDSSSSLISFDELIKHQNNRILANALIKDGRKDLNKKVINEIKNMTNSKNPFFVAAGIYAVGEIGKHYKETNLVYYNTNLKFLKLVESLQYFFEHENEMVRRQALFAAKKINDENVNMFIGALYDKTSSLYIKYNIEEYFFNKKKNRSTASNIIKKSS